MQCCVEKRLLSSQRLFLVCLLHFYYFEPICSRRLLKGNNSSRKLRGKSFLTFAFQSRRVLHERKFNDFGAFFNCSVEFPKFDSLN